MGSPNIPPSPPNPPPPASPTDQSIKDARRRNRGKARTGFQQTLLTGAQGVQERGQLGFPTLLGTTGGGSSGTLLGSQ